MVDEIGVPDRAHARTGSTAKKVARATSIAGLVAFGATPVWGIGQVGLASVASAAPTQDGQTLANGLPVGVLPAPAQLDTGTLPTSGGPRTYSVKLSNADLVAQLLASNRLNADQRTFLEGVSTEATFTVGVAGEAPAPSGGVSPQSTGCGSGSGTWNCVYTLNGQCNDPIIGTPETIFDVYEGMSGNYKNVTNVSHPNYHIDEQYGWSPGAPSFSEGTENNATAGWMNASEGFDFIKYALHQQYNYQLTVQSNSNYSANLGISCT